LTEIEAYPSIIAKAEAPFISRPQQGSQVSNSQIKHHDSCLTIPKEHLSLISPSYSQTVTLLRTQLLFLYVRFLGIIGLRQT
jgi:hypothetical protein